MKLVPDPETIIEGFYTEHEAFLALTRPAEAVETETKTEVQDQAEADPNRCQAMTKNGRRCRNRALDGSDFCRVHQGK
ncbi:MAG: hypothetical protein KDE47_06925 [Caldilineaceae bacterium]|nr:hypothetical protein [Caldilineaceae bacterium]